MQQYVRPPPWHKIAFPKIDGADPLILNINFMETLEAQIQNTRHLLKQARTLRILKHTLSPLELKATRNLFQPFSYKLAGITVYVSAVDSRAIMYAVIHKLNALNTLLEKHKALIKVPIKKRAMFDDVRIILSLPAVTRNKLCALGCVTLLDIMQNGRAYFINEQKFGKKAMKTLDGLFSERGFSYLFV